MVAKGSLPPCGRRVRAVVGWGQSSRQSFLFAPGPGDARGSKDLDEGAVVGVVIVGVAGDQDRAVAVDPGTRVSATRQRVVRKDRPGRSPPLAADRRRRLRRAERRRTMARPSSWRRGRTADRSSRARGCAPRGAGAPLPSGSCSSARPHAVLRPIQSKKSRSCCRAA